MVRSSSSEKECPLPIFLSWCSGCVVGLASNWQSGGPRRQGLPPSRTRRSRQLSHLLDILPRLITHNNRWQQRLCVFCRVLRQQLLLKTTFRDLNELPSRHARTLTLQEDHIIHSLCPFFFTGYIDMIQLVRARKKKPFLAQGGSRSTRVTLTNDNPARLIAERRQTTVTFIRKHGTMPHEKGPQRRWDTGLVGPLTRGPG